MKVFFQEASLLLTSTFVQTEQEDRGGMTFHAYAARFAERTVSVWVRDMPDGKVEQYQVSASE